jgi:aspartate/methionine/tyrosine aminotransferase
MNIKAPVCAGTAKRFHGGHRVLVSNCQWFRSLAAISASDVEFAHWMTREIGVAPVPGASFFAPGENRYVRLNFAKNPATLHAAGERLLRLKQS